MASCDAQGAEHGFFPAPLPPGILYRAFQPMAWIAAMQAIMAAVCLHAQMQNSPTGKNASQETHSLLFTCVKANKTLASTSRQQQRDQILKST